MGFYGHITNMQKTSMTFDRTYSNRTAMDKGAATDGVYAGRYVLIEYDNPLDATLLAGVVHFDGMLYGIPTLKQSSEYDANDPNTYLEKLEPLKVNTEATEDLLNGFLKADIVVVCSADFNLGVVSNEDGDKRIVSMSRKQYFRTATSNQSKMSYNLFYNHKDKKFQLDDSSSREAKTGCAFLEISYSPITTNSEEANSNYLINFNIDLDNYSTSRGYDSTVWQKTYADGKPKYVMIAELNSVVPVLDIAADAPTLSPVMPHFDIDNTNIYYKLHMQPSWGFRIKGANPTLTVPTLDYSGSVITTSGRDIHASSDVLEYPSDQDTQWINTIYDAEKSDYTNQYLEEISLSGTTSVKGQWKKDPQNVRGAIYFNRAGFDKNYINHSSSYPYTKRDLTINPLKDEITLTPTGFSGHMYPTHTVDGKNEVQPDVNELAVLLPSIGDTISDVWNLIYGGADVSTDEGGALKRNTVIRWEDAKKVHAKEGLRLVRDLESPIGYSYRPEEVNSVAGVINSVQDIMGMIITKYNPDDAISTLNEDYIYYHGGKYYYKKPTYTYEKIEGDVDYEKVELEGWDSKYWWVDTNHEDPDYIKEETFRPERKYVSGVKVPSGDDEAKPHDFTTSSYEPNKYYLFQQYEVPETQTPFLDSTTKAPYVRYVKSQDRVQDPNKIYYSLELTKVELEANSVFYVPNKYYAGYFYSLPKEITSEDDFEAYLADGIRLFYPISAGIGDYDFVKAVELSSGQYNQGVVPQDQWSKVKYLTLRTCALSSAEYASLKQKGQAPILFTDDTEKKNTAQNYYVMEEKYEYIDTSNPTWKDAVAQAPGVYYFIDLKKTGLTKDKILENGNLKPVYAVDSILQKENDIVLEADNIYFRKVVSLKLGTASDTSIVDILSATQVDPQPFPDNLYVYFTDKAGATPVEGYRSVSILSSEIVSAKDYSLLTLYSIERKRLAVGYEPNSYYYQMDKGELKDSVVLDNRLTPDPNAKYWPPEVINKRQLTDKEIKAGRQAGVTYYRYTEVGNTYVEHTGAFAANTKYYVSSLDSVPEIYYPNKYYYQDAATGEFLLSTGPFDPNKEYYRNPQLYILEDPNGFYEQGALWPIAQNPPAGSGIVLAKRKDSWEMRELKGFDVNFNTLHGLLLRLNKWMLQNDTLTRDEETLQGALNTLNDLINRFGTMKPGQLMMVDNTGRMAGVTYTTKQTFSAENHGGQGVTIVETEADQNGEDQWIDFDTTNDYKQPKITIKHNFTKVEDTTSASNNNTTKADTINLYTPIVDAKGHVVGKNTETVTLPFGFKTFKATNNNAETLSQETLATNSDVVAETTQDSLTLQGKNKWIELTTDATNDSITIAHRARNEMTDTTNDTVVMDDATDAGRNVLGKVLADVGYDPAGHLISRTYTNFKLPNSYQSFTDADAHMSTARNAHDTFTIKGDTWLHPLVEQNSVTFSHKAESAQTSTLTTVIMDSSENRDTFGPVVHDFEWDDAGHITAKKYISYTLPNGYQTFAVSGTEKTTATNAHDTLTIAGDDWVKPEIVQGTLTYKHINNKMGADFTALGAHTLGGQTPQFGETFNLQTYTLDANGHIVNKSTETVTIPTNISGLLLTSFNDESCKYIKTGDSLEVALTALDAAIDALQANVDANKQSAASDILALTTTIEEFQAEYDETVGEIRNEMVEGQTALLDAIDDSVAATAETLRAEIAAVSEAAAPVEGNINQETTFVYKETGDEGEEVVTTVAQAIRTLSLVDEEAIRNEQTFVYTPAVEEVSHEATQEEVDAGLATTLGEKIIDVEYVPAEELTIAQLFAKVKLLEAALKA